MRNLFKHFAILTNADFKVLARTLVSQRNLIGQGLWESTTVYFSNFVCFFVSKHENFLLKTKASINRDINNIQKQISTRITSANSFFITMKYIKTVPYEVSSSSWSLTFPSGTEANCEALQTWSHELIKRTIDARLSRR